MEKSIVSFDLDSTLAESKLPVDAEMAELLARLLAVKKVAVISGASFNQMTKQVISLLSPEHANLANLYALPTNGNSLYSFSGSWEVAYTNPLSDEDKKQIFGAFERAFADLAYEQPAQVYGTLIEDRGAQLSFSGLGSEAPLTLKAVWDPTHEKRAALKAAVEKYLPGFFVSIAGTTSVDVTRGANKASGLLRFLDHLGAVPADMVFIGDAFYPGGNDESVESIGCEWRSVKSIAETKGIIRELLGER